ncbi:hypothetical protein Hamer_G026426 [Homarus americanus]|uniref:Uncharacterized protein n=1 Tax=Homarus americanus TaxID=6706 RepID=A0A8J5JI36_HOMAM|nr:hypothetical protein Hamer_G026426 [Homarus americanus]
MPNWLSSYGPVLLRRHVRNSKYDPLVDEVELLEANPRYAHVRFPDARQSTVSLRDLAPAGQAVPDTADPEPEPTELPKASTSVPLEPTPGTPGAESPVRDDLSSDARLHEAVLTDSPSLPRRSGRVRRKPDFYGFPDV